MNSLCEDRTGRLYNFDQRTGHTRQTGWRLIINKMQKKKLKIPRRAINDWPSLTYSWVKAIGSSP